MLGVDGTECGEDGRPGMTPKATARLQLAVSRSLQYVREVGSVLKRGIEIRGMMGS